MKKCFSDSCVNYSAELHSSEQDQTRLSHSPSSWIKKESLLFQALVSIDKPVCNVLPKPDAACNFEGAQLELLNKDHRSTSFQDEISHNCDFNGSEETDSTKISKSFNLKLQKCYLNHPSSTIDSSKASGIAKLFESELDVPSNNIDSTNSKEFTEVPTRISKLFIDPSNLDQAALNKFQAAQGELSSALSRLLVSVERYPDIKFNQNFRDLQVQLEGTENRITVARQRFNEGVQGYNGYIRKFPNNLFAGLFGFEKKAYFEAEEDSQNEIIGNNITNWEYQIT